MTKRQAVPFSDDKVSFSDIAPFLGKIVFSYVKIEDESTSIEHVVEEEREA